MTSKRPSLLSAVLSGIAGRGVAILAGVVAPPLVAKRLGVESWGVVGAFAALSTLTALLDVGLSTTLTREVARVKGTAQRQHVADLIVTFATLFTGLATVIFLALSSFLALGGSALAIGSEFEAMPGSTPIAVLAVLGVAAAFPQIALGGALNGLDRQPAFAVFTAGGAVARSLGGLLVVMLRPGLVTYFSWLALSTLTTTLLMAWSLRESIAGGRFVPALLRQSAGYAAGVWATSALGLLLSQFDKLLVPRLCGLRAAGCYAFAVTASGALYSFVAPSFSVALTRLSASEGKRQAIYSEALSIMLGVLTPTALVLSAFAPEALLLWTRDEAIVAEAAFPLRILSVAVLLHGTAHIPYALSLATGHARLGVWQNSFACVVFLPLGWLATKQWGSTGAASVWLLITGFFVFVASPVINRVSDVSTLAYLSTIVRLTSPVALIVWLTRLVSSAVAPLSFTSASVELGAAAVLATMTVLITNPVLRGLAGEISQRLRSRASNRVR